MQVHYNQISNEMKACTCSTIETDNALGGKKKEFRNLKIFHIVVHILYTPVHIQLVLMILGDNFFKLNLNVALNIHVCKTEEHR